MALTRDFKRTVSERIARDPSFARAVLDEAASLFLNGQPETARLTLRELVNATVGFDGCRQQPASLPRAFTGCLCERQSQHGQPGHHLRRGAAATWRGIRVKTINAA